MIKRALLVLALILQPLTAHAEDEEIPPLVDRGSTILLIGDSLGVGLGPEFNVLAKASGYIPAIHSKGGTVTAQWLRWVKKDLTFHKPKLVIVSLGTNDAGFNIEQIRKNSTVYARLVKEIADSGAKVVWIGPPKLSHKRLPHADEIRSIIRDSIGVPYYESQVLDIQQDQDKIHATVKGYRMWMDAVWTWMAQRNIVKQ